MTSEETKAELATLRTEFYAKEVTRERQVEIAERVREFAEEEGSPRCLYCKRAGISIPYTEALIEGHCYSSDGVRDFTRITGVCEFCFDALPSDEEHEGEWDEVFGTEGGQ